jgi:hypothetical protein
VTAGPVRDFDFHPDEDDVRVFTVHQDGVLRWDSDAYVGAARYGDVVFVALRVRPALVQDQPHHQRIRPDRGDRPGLRRVPELPGFVWHVTNFGCD